jgi:hypothetical protein
MDVDVRRLPMASYLGVPPAPQPVVEIRFVPDGVGVIGVGVLVDAHDVDSQLVLAGGVLRRAAEALLATDVTWSSRGRPWRGSHATMTPTQLANQLLNQGFRSQHLRFMAGLGSLRHQQQHYLILPPHSYFGAPAGESPFFVSSLESALLLFRIVFDAPSQGSDDGSDSDAPASSASGDDESESDATASSVSDDDEEQPHYDDEGNTTPPRPRSPAVTMLTATRAFLGGAGPPTAGGSTSESSDDDSDFGDDIWQSGDESGDETRRSRSRSPRDASRRVTTSQ